MSSRFHERAMIALIGAVASACGASQPQQSTVVSSADTVSYAVAYPDEVTAAAHSFAEHKLRAHALSIALAEHTPQLKPGDSAGLAYRVIAQADVDGRRQAFVDARRSDVELRAFWDSERGALSARVVSAVKDAQTEAGCTQLDPQPVVQRALRDGLNRPFERRVRDESEAQRLLDQYRAQLTPASWQALQRLASEVSLASYLVNVALIDDVMRLSRMAEEREMAWNTLWYALQEERAFQASQAQAPKSAAVQASQERTARIEKSRAAMPVSNAKADGELFGYAEQLQLAIDEYNVARRSILAAFSPPARPAAAAK
jgi:hypothetical protein